VELHDEIEMIAYELWEKSGRVHGRDLEHWFEAETIVKERYELKRREEEKPKEKKKLDKVVKKSLKTQKRKKSR
jgi:hypothetical protein